MIIGIIPARYGSTRFPGKPLAPIAGRPLITRVIEAARCAVRGMDGIDIVVATDDERIAMAAQSADCSFTMTSADLSTGSSRALAAAVVHHARPAFVVNMQGDSPFVPPEAVASVIRALEDGASVATPVIQLTWEELDAFRVHKQSTPFSGTTCIVGADHRALWFSKQIVPAIRDEQRRRSHERLSPVFRHLGVYGFAIGTLRLFEQLPPSPLECVEGLEQLRLLEAGISIRACPVTVRQHIPIGGIDTPEDVVLAERLLAMHGEFPNR